jgi:hypothetical protein
MLELNPVCNMNILSAYKYGFYLGGKFVSVDNDLLCLKYQGKVNLIITHNS